MKRKEFALPGQINNSGGLKMFMGELNEFFKENPGKRLIARFVILSDDPTERQKGYYFNYIVPEMKTVLWQNGDRKTEEETELFLREVSPVCYASIPNINTGKYERVLREFSDLSKHDLTEHIEFIKQMAAEEYSAYIDDAK